MAKILLVEDDEAQRLTIEDWLSPQKHVVDSAATGDQGLYQSRHYDYDLLIVDWQLPDISGLELIKAYRENGGQAPILMMTGKKEIDDKVQGLQTGADDYMTKPCDLRELSARIEALLRRRNTMFEGNVLQHGEIKVDTINKRVYRGDVEIQLLPKEYAVLEFLTRNSQRCFKSDELLRHVWSSDSDATEVAVRSTIARLRKKIELDGETIIHNVRGFGYGLRKPD